MRGNQHLICSTFILIKVYDFVRTLHLTHLIKRRILEGPILRLRLGSIFDLIHV